MRDRAQFEKLFILGIDGVPLSLVLEAVKHHSLPHFMRLVETESIRELNSVIPVVSAVAWATFSTGTNPGSHGIYGFVDRDADLNYIIQTSQHFRTSSIWRTLEERRLKAISINVPGTYPPEPINGLMIGDFLAPSLEKATHPQSLVPKLKQHSYIIDANPQLAHTDRSAFMEELHLVLDARKRITRDLMETQKWDVFMLHIMETDRLHHFFWDSQFDARDMFYSDFWGIYREIDQFIGELISSLSSETGLMILSDHGFCGVKFEVDVNKHLLDEGFLSFPSSATVLSDLDVSSTAYSLTPGRIYLNLEKRERHGSVRSADKEKALADLKVSLSEIKDPETGDRVVEKIWTKEELYNGAELEKAPDLICHPHNGYDLKSTIGGEALFSKGHLQGMHTFEDALICLRDAEIPDGPLCIGDLRPLILELIGVDE